MAQKLNCQRRLMSSEAESSHWCGHAAADKSTVSRRGITNVQLRRFHALTALDVTGQRKIENPARQQRSLYRIWRGASGLQEFLDVHDLGIEVLRAGRRWEVEHARSGLRFALDPGSENKI